VGAYISISPSDLELKLACILHCISLYVVDIIRKIFNMQCYASLACAVVMCLSVRLSQVSVFYQNDFIFRKQVDSSKSCPTDDRLSYTSNAD